MIALVHSQDDGAPPSRI